MTSTVTSAPKQSARTVSKSPNEEMTPAQTRFMQKILAEYHKGQQQTAVTVPDDRNVRFREVTVPKSEGLVASGQSKWTDAQDVESNAISYDEIARQGASKNFTAPRVQSVRNQSPPGHDQRTSRRPRDPSADSLDRASDISGSRRSRRDSPERLYGISTPKFTGEGSVEDFFLQFDDVSSLLAWKGENLARRLRLSLQDKALRVVRNMLITSTYDEIKRKLVRKYRVESSASTV